MNQPTAQLEHNMDVVDEHIVKNIPVPQRDLASPPYITIIHSFDVNKSGYEIDRLRGGVVGGTRVRV